MLVIVAKKKERGKVGSGQRRKIITKKRRTIGKACKHKGKKRKSWSWSENEKKKIKNNQ